MALSEKKKKREKDSGNLNEAHHAKKKKKQFFIYGNYRGYYGYRIAQGVSEDQRLSIFKKEWFEDKDCLDIGCNQGVITIDVARKFSCKSILGIDIDGSLVENAYWTWRKISKQELVSAERNAKSENHFSKCHEGVSEKGSKKLKSEASGEVEHKLLNIVSFRKENIVEKRYCSSQYDTILCLSVTKWIHLNWGDEGLITLFTKVWQMLRPGGIFILEPQPWESYIKNIRVSETARINYENILFTPDMFRNILLDHIGFRSVNVVSEPLSANGGGFDRPIYIFYK